MRRPALEVRIPISPRPDYFNRVRVIAASIREFYPDARIRVTVGSPERARDLHEELPWSAALGIDWHWITADEFLEWKDTEHPYIATMMERFRPPFHAQRVLMLDADVLAVRRFDELFEGEAVKGIMAHASPFRREPHSHQAVWEQLFRGYGLEVPAFDCEVSGWGTMEFAPELRYSPPYMNTGVLFASPQLLERLYDPYMAALRFVRTQMDSYFFEQIALTLAAAKAGIPIQLLTLRYNYPNQSEFDAAHPAELADVRLLHFLRTDAVHRERDFGSLEATRALIARRDLRGSNEIFRARVSAIVDSNAC